MESLPQAAGGFGSCDGSTCWGRGEGSVGQGTPSRAPLVPPPPSSRLGPGPRCWPARTGPPNLTPLPGSPAAPAPSPAEKGKRRHRPGAAWLPSVGPLLPRRRHQPPGVHAAAAAQGESLLGLPAASRLLPTLHSRLFFPLNASHTPPAPASRPLGNPRGPQPSYIFLLFIGPPSSHPHTAPTPRGGSERPSQDVAR